MSSAAAIRIQVENTLARRVPAALSLKIKHATELFVRRSASLHLPLLATGGVSYATTSERDTLDIFTCTRHRTTLDTSGRLLQRNSERYLRAAREMEKLFYDYPDAIGNTGELSARLQFDLSRMGYEFPPYQLSDGETMNSFLRKRTEEGIRLSYLPKNNPALFERAKRQAERELRLIEDRGLAGIFLLCGIWCSSLRRAGFSRRGVVPLPVALSATRLKSPSLIR